MKKCVYCTVEFEGTSETCSRSCRVKQQNSQTPVRICGFDGCGDEFQPKSPNSRYCSPKHDVECPLCEKVYSTSSSQPKSRCGACGRKVAQKNREKTNLDRYGSVSPLGNAKVREKIVATNLKNLGVENPAQSESVQEKIKSTNIERYGVERPTQNPAVREKTKETNLDRYGVEYPLQSKELKEKVQSTNLARHGSEWAIASESVRKKGEETNLERYGNREFFASDEFKENLPSIVESKYGVRNVAHVESVQEKRRATNLERYGYEETFFSPEIREKAKATILARYGVEHPAQNADVQRKTRETNERRYGPSLSDQSNAPYVPALTKSEWGLLLEAEFGVQVTFEKSVGGRSFDLHVVGSNILLEINPTVTHNSLVPYVRLRNGCASECGHSAPRPSQHKSRADLAQAHGYSLVQVYDWDDKQRVLNLLHGKLVPNFRKLSARKCEVVPISAVVANEFLQEFHFQGGVRGQAYCYGLMFDGELIAVATFGLARFGASAYEFEWLRFAVRRGTIVHGGAQYLWKRFVADHDPSSVVSYIDYDHTTAPITFLNSCGFVEAGVTSSQVWSRKRLRVAHSSLVMQGADRLLGTSYGSRDECGLGNDEIMVLEGWLPVSTSGNRVFNYTKTMGGKL